MTIPNRIAAGVGWLVIVGVAAHVMWIRWECR